MGVVVQFDYAAWIARYPEMTGVSSQTAAAYFSDATVYHRNDGGGPVTKPHVQSMLLNTLTAHIAWISSPRDAFGKPNSSGPMPPPALVGRVTSASEGSVSVSTDNSYPPGTPQWFQQTIYGAAYWAASAQYRTLRYIPGHPRLMGPFPTRRR